METETRQTSDFGHTLPNIGSLGPREWSHRVHTCAPPLPANSQSQFLEISHLGPKNDPRCWSDNISSFLGPLMKLSPEAPLTKKEATNNVELDN